MLDARDAEDSQLLDAGDLAGLVAKYQPLVIGRCVAKLRGHADAEDVAQNVMLRLVREFQAGKRYGETPYRVVVNNVIDWTVREYFQGKDTSLPLPDDWDAGGGHFADELVSRYYVADLFEPLPDGDRRVMKRYYLLGWDIPQIADDLAMRRNAVDQALYRGRKAIRQALADG